MAEMEKRAAPASETTVPSQRRGGQQIGLQFRPDIEGLRAVAVLLVVLFHAQVSWVRGGFVGVDVFYVISGFLITGLLLRERDVTGRVSMVNFYARRVRRILPAAVLVIVLVLVGSYYMQGFITFTSVRLDARWATVFGANFHFASSGTNYFGQGAAPSPLQHYWSLSVEEQFYFVWPALFILVAGLASRLHHQAALLVSAVLITVFSFVWSIHQTSQDPILAYFSPFTRAWEIGLGAVLALLGPQLRRTSAPLGQVVAWLGLAMIVTSAVIFSAATPFPGSAALLPVVGAAAVIAGGSSGLGASRLLGLRPVCSIGRVSFGWYLLHYPLMVLLVGPIWTAPMSVGSNLAIAGVTLAFAYAMYWVIERPIHRSEFLAARPWATLLFGAILLTAALGASFVLKPGIHALWIG